MPRVNLISAMAISGLLLLYLCVRDSSFAQLAPPKQVAPTEPGSIGRFQVVARQGTTDAWLIDTSTGQIWRETQVNELAGQPLVWKFEERVDTAAEFIKWRDIKKLGVEAGTGH